MTWPEVSIVVPNFNKAPYLEETIDSVVAQREVAEAIFVDDASTDGSVPLLESAAASHPSVRLIRSDRNVGGSACRNAGLAAARGEFVMFMDSDDLLAPSCCESRLAAARRHPDGDLWVFPMLVFRERPEEPFDRWVPRPGDHLRHFLAHRLDWSVFQPLWRTGFVRRIGGFDESFPRLQDPEIHTKALLQGARVMVFPEAEPDCLYRVTPDRHDRDASGLAGRHVAGTLRYCQVFAPQVGPRLLPMLSGTLLACQNMLLQWWRDGRLPSDELDRLQRSLVAACPLARHARILDASFRIQRVSPFHLPGMRRATKALLGLP